MLLPIIKRIPNKIEQASWVQELAKKLKVNEQAVEQELQRTKIEEEVFGLEPEEREIIPQKSRKELLEERLLILSLQSKALTDSLSDDFCAFLSPQALQIISCLKEGKEIPSELSESFNYLGLKADIEEGLDIEEGSEEEQIKEEISDCLNEIRTMAIKDRLDSISQEIKKAEAEKDKEKLQKLTEEFNKLAKKIA